MRNDYPLTYETLLQFWERRLSPQSMPVSSVERQEEIRRMAEAINSIFHSRDYMSTDSDNQQQYASNSMPVIHVAEIESLKEEMVSLKRKLNCVEKTCHDQRRHLQDVQRQCLMYYEMAYGSNIEALRQLTTSKKLKKLIRLMSYYLPTQVQRQLRKIVDRMDNIPTPDEQDDIQSRMFKEQVHVQALEYQNSSQNFEGDVQQRESFRSKGEFSDQCRALVPWKDYRDYWPVYCSQLPTGDESQGNLAVSQESFHHYGPQRPQSFQHYPPSGNFVGQPLKQEESELYCTPSRGCCTRAHASYIVLSDERGKLIEEPSPDLRQSLDHDRGGHIDCHERAYEGSILTNLQKTLLSLSGLCQNMATQWL